jgi:hypothetical protein
MQHEAAEPTAFVRRSLKSDCVRGSDASFRTRLGPIVQCFFAIHTETLKVWQSRSVMQDLLLDLLDVDCILIQVLDDSWWWTIIQISCQLFLIPTPELCQIMLCNIRDVIRHPRRSYGFQISEIAIYEKNQRVQE